MTSPVFVPVDLGARSYDVVIGESVLDTAGTYIAPLLKRPRVTVITDATVQAAHGHRVLAALDAAGIAHDLLAVPPGEGSKSFDQLEVVLTHLLASGFERSDTLIALGGGVIGDLGGLAAALLRRGVPFIQIPTTLLAQVDSSVGGKTGINTAHGKNLVGAFYQPILVLADTGVLDTLTQRQVLAGYAEVVKYGLIDDLPFFEWLEQHGASVIAGDAAARAHAIAMSVRAKARIVAEDEKEAGQRALLNLGHTFAHALEAEAGYNGMVLHGEAVAVGLILALQTSAALGWCTAAEVTRVITHFKAVGLPVCIRNLAGVSCSWATLWHHMQQDKKVAAGQITFVMSKGLGGAFLTRDVPKTVVRQVLEASL